MLINKSKIKEEYDSLKNNFSDYKALFGTIDETLYSPYFHFACVLSIITVWVPEKTTEWQSIAQDILPDMLGFSLGGYAVLISFGDTKFRQYLAKKKPNGGNNSLFMLLNGVFVHFIIAQLLAIIIAVLLSTLNIDNIIINIIGCTVFYYAISFCVAVAFEIKTVGKWYQSFINGKKGIQQTKKKDQG